MSATANWMTESNQSNPFLYISVCTAGDVNGDGYHDLLVGAGSCGNGHTDEGRISMYYGNAIASFRNDLRLCLLQQIQGYMSISLNEAATVSLLCQLDL